MSNKLRIPLTTIKRYHLDLFNQGYIRVAKKDVHKGYVYEVTKYQEYESLQSGVGQVLDDNLNRLKQATQPSSPVAAQYLSEPLNNIKTNVINNQPTTTSKKTMRTEKKEVPQENQSLPKALPTNAHSQKSTVPSKGFSGKEQLLLLAVEKSLPLHLQAYLSVLLDHLAAQPTNQFSSTSIVELTPHSKRTLRNYHKDLVRYGFIAPQHRDKNGMTYRLEVRS